MDGFSRDEGLSWMEFHLVQVVSVPVSPLFVIHSRLLLFIDSGLHRSMLQLVRQLFVLLSRAHVLRHGLRFVAEFYASAMTSRKP